MRCLVTGGGGFIGWHLIKRLVGEGHYVRAVDIKRPEFGETAAHEFLHLDLMDYDNCVHAIRGMEVVYHLSARMGGIGFITREHARIAHDNLIMDTHMLEAAYRVGIDRLFFSSSACVYPAHKQDRPDIQGLKESDAIPADPEDGYGWEKLMAEQMCAYYYQDHGLETRIARFHNILGPRGTWTGGLEKAPAAICRKVAEAEEGGELVLWGDGKATRSFCYIDDCVEGILRIMKSEYRGPVNLGTEELVTVDQLAETIMDVAGKRLTIVHDTSKPQGVRGRNSDNTLLREVTGWEPKTKLRDGIAKLYPWVHDQVNHA